MTTQSSFFALVFLFSATIVRAAVLPTRKGEGIWNVVTRIASALNSIVPYSSAYCSVPITQSDIDFGDTFVITTSNATYCLSQNITFTTGAAITIAGSDITLDLNGKIIDGQNNSTVGIRLGEDVQNVIIKNGIIKNIGGLYFNGVAIQDVINHTVLEKNIIIQDMNFSNNAQGAIDLTNANSDIRFSIDGVLIENCRAINSGFIAIDGPGIIRGCIVEESRLTLANGGGIWVGGQRFLLTRDAVIEDCIATGSSATIQISSAYNGIIRNCIVQGVAQNETLAVYTGAAIFMGPCQQGIISDCVAQGIGVNNILAKGFAMLSVGGSMMLERCTATFCVDGFNINSANGPASTNRLLQLIDCVAENNFLHGFDLRQASGSPMANFVLKRCCATANGATGFLVTINPMENSLSQILFEDCIAQQNGGDGFGLLNLTSSSILQHVLFRNCFAQRNLGGLDLVSGVTHQGNGFSVGAALGNVGPIEDVVFEDCIAQGNAHDGFDFGSTSSIVNASRCFSMNNIGTGFNLAGVNNYAIGCMATGNGLDFVGISDPTLQIFYNLPGAINGVGRCVNVSSHA